MEVKRNISYKNWCVECVHFDFSARLFQHVWKQYKNKHYKWKNEIIHKFISNMINYNMNKNALFQVLSSSKEFDYKLISKMQSVMKVYNHI